MLEYGGTSLQVRHCFCHYTLLAPLILVDFSAELAPPEVRGSLVALQHPETKSGCGEPSSRGGRLQRAAGHAGNQSSGERTWKEGGRRCERTSAALGAPMTQSTSAHDHDSLPFLLINASARGSVLGPRRHGPIPRGRRYQGMDDARRCERICNTANSSLPAHFLVARPAQLPAHAYLHNSRLLPGFVATSHTALSTRGRTRRRRRRRGRAAHL